MDRQPVLTALLLDMLSTVRQVEPARVAALTETDWAELDQMVLQHRLAPLLSHRHRQRGADWGLPDKIAHHWQARYRTASQRALRQQRALVEVGAVFDRAEIPYAALKGAWLAWHAYPQPALRPMRDIDFLVSDGDAERAFAALLAAGAKVSQAAAAPADYARDHHKHMPQLIWGDPGVAIEIHWRLSHPVEGESGGAVRATNAALMARRIPAIVAGSAVAYLDPTDSLLHLIVHAAYDHRFDNGPTILSDIEAILTTATIDWPRFWAAAADGGWTSGARLLFDLAETYHGCRAEAGGMIPSSASPPALLAIAEALMLKDMGDRKHVYFAAAVAAQHGWRNKMAHFVDRAFPPRHIVAHYAGLPMDSRRVWAWYPVRLTAYIWQWLRRDGDPTLKIRVSDELAMRQWLSNPHP